jgi:hypothetical protein
LVAYAVSHPEDETLRRQIIKLASRDRTPSHAKEASRALPSSPR